MNPDPVESIEERDATTPRRTGTVRTVAIVVILGHIVYLAIHLVYKLATK